MNERLLDLVLAYGVAALVPILLASAIGVPLPGSLLLVAAGAFAGAGQLSLVALVLGAIGATLAGNGVGYWLGRRGGETATARWGKRLHIADSLVARAEGFFARYGGLSVLLSRFPFSPLSALVNILAGAARYPLRPFALANVAGVSAWVGVYAGLGYAFGASWELIATVLGNATQALTLAVVVATLAFLLVRAIRHHHDHDEEPATAPSSDTTTDDLSPAAEPVPALPRGPAGVD